MSASDDDHVVALSSSSTSATSATSSIKPSGISNSPGALVEKGEVLALGSLQLQRGALAPRNLEAELAGVALPIGGDERVDSRPVLSSSGSSASVAPVPSGCDGSRRRLVSGGSKLRRRHSALPGDISDGHKAHAVMHGAVDVPNNRGSETEVLLPAAGGAEVGIGGSSIWAILCLCGRSVAGLWRRQLGSSRSAAAATSHVAGAAEAAASDKVA